MNIKISSHGHYIPKKMETAEEVSKKINKSPDWIISRTGVKNRRISTKNTHGTGCTLSAAICTFFSCGKTLKRSCELATKYVHSAIGSNLNYGKGHGPINHLSLILVDKKLK